jgi:starch synthase (maltosyl-transferring)
LNAFNKPLKIMQTDRRNRVIIQNVQPEIDDGRHFIKRVVNEWTQVTADIFSDGHDAVRASLHYRHESNKNWTEAYMEAQPNDVWTAAFQVTQKGFYHYKLEAWVDHLLNWHNGFLKKQADRQDMAVELLIGADLLKRTAKGYPKAKAAALDKAAELLEKKGAYDEATAAVLTQEFADMVLAHPMKQFQTWYDKDLRVRIGRDRAVFSAWYELFPRSAAAKPGDHGTFKDMERILPRLQELGFDVLYLPPIHPIGTSNRKGKNNSLDTGPHEPGSPWAIGNTDGGHTAIHKQLGTLKDYQHLIAEAQKHGLEIAFDLALQCSPDHPWVKEHPEWFLWRPDGTIAYAENPPKKYQDIVPINFETEDWRNLWEELKKVILFWVDAGVLIFRVDNPHTKPFAFWEWVINEVHSQHPDVIFLAEAFTRPKIMGALGKLGFSQSYTYFTWRNNRREMEEYLTELTQTEWRDYYRPNFWPNTPDILPYHLMDAGANVFVLRLLMAATLSSNYGVYGPSYEFMENKGNTNGKEEYLDSEKYELRTYDWNARNRITEAMTAINRIRREQPALQRTFNLTFTRADNESLMSFVKVSDDGSNVIWCVVNFDAQYTQSGYVEVPKKLLGIEGRVNLKVTDLLTEETYHWFNDWNYVEINPNKFPMHLFWVSMR